MTGRRPLAALRAGVLVAAIAASFAPTASQGQEIVTPIGTEQLVVATGDSPALVYDDQGRGVVTWVEAGTSTAPATIRARRLSGDTLGAPFQVSTPSTTIWSEDPRVAMDAQGGFVVVWSANEVRGQLFRADGRPRGGQLTLTPRNVGGFHPEVAMAPDGRFALAWEQSHWDPQRAVRLATFTNRGTRLGRAQTMPAIGTLANLVGAVSASPTSVAVGWTEFTPCPSNPIDPVSAVYTFNWQLSPLRAVDRLANDNPCVDGPQVLALPNSDGGPLGIFVGRRYSIQRFSPLDGTRIGPRTNVAEFPACPGGSACERVKTVAGDRRGRFVFIWERFENGVYNLVAELYGREGVKRVERFPINSHASTTEERPTAALTSDGTLVVTWHREGEGVLMRRFRIE
jgi:hypothetical protein